jgi:biotin carboxyl carrier protein
MKYIATVEDEVFEIEINEGDEILVNGERFDIDFRTVAGQQIYSLLVGGRSIEGLVQPTETGMEVLLLGRLFNVLVEDERQRRLRESSAGQIVQGGKFHLKAPMPGLIVSLPVTEGDEVKQGDDLVILESMKMQNELKAPRDGHVERVQIKIGDSVELNQVLVTLG